MGIPLTAALFPGSLMTDRPIGLLLLPNKKKQLDCSCRVIRSADSYGLLSHGFTADSAWVDLASCDRNGWRNALCGAVRRILRNCRVPMPCPTERSVGWSGSSRALKRSVSVRAAWFQESKKASALVGRRRRRFREPRLNWRGSP